MSFLTTKTARSMMYLCSIGGLLVVNGIVIMIVWNEFLSDKLASDIRLTFLEGTGIAAFAYVVVFSVKYGAAAGTSLRGNPRTESVATRCAGMTAEQRAALRAELVQSCGCKESEQP